MFHQPYASGCVAHGPGHLVMSLMTNEDNLVSFSGEADRLQVDLSHQGASGVDRVQPALGGGSANSRRHPVRAVENVAPFGDFLHTVHEYDAPLPEAFDHRPIVNDFVVNV